MTPASTVAHSACSMTRGTASSGNGRSSPAKSKVTPWARYELASASVRPRSSACVIFASVEWISRYDSRATSVSANISSQARGALAHDGRGTVAVEQVAHAPSLVRGCCGVVSTAPRTVGDDREVSIASVAGENWAGSHIFAASALLEATTIAEVQEVVRAAAGSGGRVRALGTRHSFNDLADTTGALVTVTGIDPDPVLDEDGPHGHGRRRHPLRRARLLARGAGLGPAQHGVAAAHLGRRARSRPEPTARESATGCSPAAVAGLEYVDHRGDLVSVRRGDPDFDGLVVGLGAYGIVVRVTLDIEPSYRMRQDVYRDLPWQTVLDDLETVMGFGYSVSIFDDWQGDTVDQVWVKSRIDQLDDGLPDQLARRRTRPALGGPAHRPRLREPQRAGRRGGGVARPAAALPPRVDAEHRGRAADRVLRRALRRPRRAARPCASSPTGSRRCCS